MKKIYRIRNRTTRQWASFTWLRTNWTFNQGQSWKASSRKAAKNKLLDRLKERRVTPEELKNWEIVECEVYENEVRSYDATQDIGLEIDMVNRISHIRDYCLLKGLRAVVKPGTSVPNYAIRFNYDSYDKRDGREQVKKILTKYKSKLKKPVRMSTPNNYAFIDDSQDAVFLKMHLNEYIYCIIDLNTGKSIDGNDLPF